MNITECPSCEKELKETASFCGKCRTQVRCLGCKESLSLGDDFCESCGKEVEKRNLNSGAVNKIRFDGTSFEAEFTDNVGKDVTATLGQILIANQGVFNSKQLANTTSTKLPDSETIDINVEDVTEVNPLKEKTPSAANSIESIFREAGDRLELIETRIKASGKGDYTARLTYLIVLYYESKAEKAKKTTINGLLDLCGLNDANFRSWFSKQQKNDFLVKDGVVELRPAGREKAQKYLSDVFDTSVLDQWGLGDMKPASAGGKKSQESQVKKAGKSAAKNVSQEEFDIAVKGKTLEQFFKENSSDDSTNHRILLIGYYILKYVKQASFSDGNIDYAYRVLQLNKRPTHLRQTILNMKNKQVWITDGNPTGNWALSRNGEIYVEEKLLASKK